MKIMPFSFKGLYSLIISNKRPEHIFSPKGKLVLSVTRYGYPNIQSYASAVVCSNTGKVLGQFTKSDLQEKANIHSSIKPIHVGMLTDFTDLSEFQEEELAVMSASHSGTDEHRRQVRSILEKFKIDEKHMTCGGRYPFDEEARRRLIIDGISPAQTPKLYDQCSGHHTCQLLLSKLMNEPLEEYAKPDSKVQKWLLKKLKEYCNDSEINIVPFDNCNIPTFNLTLKSFSTLYAQLVSNPNFQVVVNSIAKHPILIGDKDSLDSNLIKVTSGNLIAKGGAEGLLAIANREKKEGMVIKEWGGNGQFRDRITICALEELGWLTKEQASILWNLRQFSRLDDKHNIKYEFNEPLWG